MRGVRLGRIAALAVAGSVALGACSSGGSTKASSTTPSTTVAANTDPALNNTVLKATLSGTNEVPNPGPVTGTGTAMIRLEPIDQMICWDVEVAGLDTVTGAHIHAGAAATNGDIKVTLDTPVNGSSMGCQVIAVPLLQQMVATPGAFYVNVHTTAYPDGAIRGQLAKQ